MRVRLLILRVPVMLSSLSIFEPFHKYNVFKITKELPLLREEIISAFAALEATTPVLPSYLFASQATSSPQTKEGGNVWKAWNQGFSMGNKDWIEWICSANRRTVLKSLPSCKEFFHW